MTQGERVKEIRKSLGLTLETFGEKVGVKKQTVSRIEHGINNLTDQMAKSICREFNVNHDWLMSGTGEMFDEAPRTVLEDLFRMYDCDDLEKSIITEYLKLSPDDRQVFRSYIRRVLSASDPEGS